MKTCFYFIRTLRTGLLTVYILHSSLILNAIGFFLTNQPVLYSTKNLTGTDISYGLNSTDGLSVNSKNIVLDDVTFTEMTEISLKGVYQSSSVWGDYDNDGDLDILITGTIDYKTPICTIYRNNGDNTFTEQTSISFTGVGESCVTWGDYDNDGDLDILISGKDKTGPICKIYRNDKNNIFTEQTSILLPGISDGTAAWGDSDNDGDLDIFLSGYSSTGYITKIFRNNGNNNFTDLSNSLKALFGSSLKLGDYDNDGDLDVLLTGNSNSGNISKIYRNEGNNDFSEQISISLLGVADGAVDWGDYDNDGDLDIFLSGYSGGIPSTVSKIYRNDGNNIFTEQSNIPLQALSSGSAQWGDYDNDGDMDILLTGRTGGIPYSASKIYRNDGNSIFIDQSNISLEGVGDGSAQWGDFDNDGDLDILLTGNGNRSIIYRNDCTKPNTSPKVPTGLTNILNGINVTLSWKNNGDTETPSSALTYNVRVGTSPGGSDVVSPHALSNGKLIVPAMGNAQLGSNFIMKNLPMNTYYWSVQAVDNGYNGSLFAVESSFTLFNAPPTVIVNSAKEISVFGAAISGSVNPNNAITTITFEYGTTPGDYSNWKSITATPSTLTGKISTPVETRLTGLSSGTNYYFRVKAVNSIGTTYSSDVSFITPPMFTEKTEISLISVSSSSSIWGDYNNDGYLDILITGVNNNSAITKIYRNNGNDTFTEQTSISLTGVGEQLCYLGRL